MTAEEPKDPGRPVSPEQQARAIQALLARAGIDPDGAWAQTFKFGMDRGKAFVPKVHEFFQKRAAQRISDGRVFVLREQLPQQGLFIGQASDGVDTGCIAHLPPDDLSTSHGVVVGASGGGKSRFAKHLVREIVGNRAGLARGARVWLFDAHGEHADLAGITDGDAPVRRAAASQIPINALTPPRGIDHSRWASIIIELFSALLWIGDAGGELLHTAIRACVSGDAALTLRTVFDWICSQRFGAFSRFRNAQETAVRALRFVIECLPMLATDRGVTVEQLWRDHWVFDTSGLSQKEAQLWISFMLRSSEFVANVEAPRFVFLEEAHLLILRADQERVLGESPLVRAFRELRKKRILLIALDQLLSHFADAVLANIGWQVIFPLQHWKCLDAAQGLTGMTPPERSVLPRLPARHAVVSSRRVRPAALIRVPEIPKLEGYAGNCGVDITSVLMEMAKESHVRVDEGRDRQAENTVELVVPVEQHVQSVKPEVRVSLDALQYLKQASITQCVPLGALDKASGESAGKGNRLRAELVGAGLVVVEVIRTGIRGAPLRSVRITEDGYAHLRQVGVAARPPKGKGGFEHVFWAMQIKRYLDERGASKTEIEMTRMAGDSAKAVDVGVEIDGELVAFEIQLSAKHAMVNVVKDLGVGFGRVVLCVLSERARKELVETLSAASETKSVMGSVEVRLLRSFL